MPTLHLLRDAAGEEMNLASTHEVDEPARRTLPHFRDRSKYPCIADIADSQAR